MPPKKALRTERSLEEADDLPLDVGEAACVERTASQISDEYADYYNNVTIRQTVLSADADDLLEYTTALEAANKMHPKAKPVDLDTPGVHQTDQYVLLAGKSRRELKKLITERAKQLEKAVAEGEDEESTTDDEGSGEETESEAES